MPDPVGAALALPSGAAVVYRAFGRPDRFELGRRLRRACEIHDLMFLVGADHRLAQALGADGVHAPERLIVQLARLRARRPDWVFTAAAHDLDAARRAAASGADAVVVSPVFPSRSPSAARPLGPARFRRIVKETGAPVYALGGIRLETIARLRGSGAAGVAAVEALS